MQVPFRGPAALALGLALAAAPPHGRAAAGTDAYLDATAARWEDVSRKIWDYAETALTETKSAALLEDVLEKEGFAVQRGAAGNADGVRRDRGVRRARRRDPRRVRRPPGPLAEGRRGEEVPRRRRRAGPGLRAQPPRDRRRRGRRRREPRARGAEAARDDPGLRHSRRGADPRQDVHAARRRLRRDGRRPLLAPRGRELPRHRRPPRDHGARRRVLREDGARRGEPLDGPQLAGRPRGLRARDVAHARARAPHGAPPPRRQGRRPRREHHPGLRARAVVRARHERRARERDGRPPEEGRRRRRPRDRDGGEGHDPRVDARAAHQRDALEAGPEAARARRRARSGTRPTRRSRRRSRRKSAFPRRGSPARCSRSRRDAASAPRRTSAR